MGGLRGSLAAQKSVKDEAESFLRGKSSAELLQLKATVESSLRDSASHDTEFMEEARSSLNSVAFCILILSLTGSRSHLRCHCSRSHS
jgi:hypothetical protein